MKTSVSINGLLLSGRQASTSLQRYCRPVCYFNAGSPYEISAVGSCFLFKYWSRCVAFFTKHQLSKIPDVRG
jgi:hypothetical protein